jgi:hypothetical protein
MKLLSSMLSVLNGYPSKEGSICRDKLTARPSKAVHLHSQDLGAETLDRLTP